jgi:hypothetical protein
MNLAESSTARLIGTVFVQRGLLSESQIRVALEIQRETGQQLGQILVERFGVSRQELASVVAEQWAEIGRSTSATIDAATNESWRRLGDIFVERGFVTPEQLEQALQRQRETGERVGEALVAQGSISKFELAGALAEQMSVLDDHTSKQASAAEATVVALPPRTDELEEPEDVPDAESKPSAPMLEVVPDPEPIHLAPEEPIGLAPEEPMPAEQPPADPSTDGPIEAPTPAFGWVAFASTTTGYRLVYRTGPVPPVGKTVDGPEVGELVVLRHGRSPIPQDERTCVFLEQLVRQDEALVAP